METAALALGIAEYSNSLSDLYGHHLYGHLASRHPKKVEIDLVEWLSDPPHCLGGRVAAIVGCSSLGAVTYDSLVDEISTSEIAVQNEGNTPECLPNHMQPDKKSELSLKHLAEVKVDGDVESYGQQCTGSVLGLETDKYRTLRILVSKRLLPMTTLAGTAMIQAWLEVVKFHVYSWSIGLKHGDPSIWDMLYNDELKCGVLSDYDVSESGQDSLVPGICRTIAIPFMAMDLLSTKYWRGEIARVYRHELEAFIWMLAVLCISAMPGEQTLPKSPVDCWMTSDYNDCRRHKVSFIVSGTLLKVAQLCKADTKHWELVQRLLIWLFEISREVVLQQDGDAHLNEDYDNVVEHWPRFVKVLKDVAITSSLKSEMGCVADFVGELDLVTSLPRL